MSEQPLVNLSSESTEVNSAAPSKENSETPDSDGLNGVFFDTKRKRWEGLRIKVVSIVIILFVAQFATIRTILLRNFEQLEENQALIDAERLQHSLLAKTDQLEISVTDYAVWNETYRFIEGRNPSYVQMQLNGSLSTAKVNAIAITNRSGRILVQKGSDFNTFNERSAQPEFLKYTLSNEIALDRASHGKIKGVLDTSAGAMLVASQPVLNGIDERTPNGVMSMGRFINSQMLKELSTTLQLPIKLYQVKDSSIPIDVQNVFKTKLKNTAIAAQILAEDTIASYVRVNDVFGKPVLILKAENQRKIYGQGLESLRYYFWSTLLMGLLSCALTLILLEYFILSRLNNLRQGVSKIGTQGKLSTRIFLPGQDELSHLAETINQTLDKLQQAQQALQNSEERYTLAVNGANDGIWDWNLQTQTIYFSPRWIAMLGYAPSELQLTPQEWIDRIHTEDKVRFETELKSYLSGKNKKVFRSEYRILHKDDSYRWVLSQGLAVRDSQGCALRIAGSQTDLTHHIALFDQLTGLPSRALFLDQLRRAFHRTERQSGYQLAVLFLDCDRFKVVNDSLGHAIGDRLLQAVARQLEDCVRPGDVVARLGGDEFAILLENLQSHQDAERVATRINQSLARPFTLEGHTVYISGSIGITFNNPHCPQPNPLQPEDLLRDADIAMYRAKAAGKSQYVIFEGTMHEQAQRSLQIETDLRQAIELGQFQLFYQPIWSLTKNAITGFESLIRWSHPQKGMISPADFIPIAEETGLILPIGQWVIHEACRQMNLWRAKFSAAESLTVSVNLSAKQFSEPNLVGQIKSTLNQTGFPPDRFKIEITETMIVENHAVAVQTLTQLKALGIQILVDDFGTGYSSLSVLHSFPLDTLKIDISFVRLLETDPENAEIVKVIIKLAQNLGMETIAEGVETQSQLLKLKALGCDFVQGYLLAKPLPPQEIEPLIAILSS